MAKMMPPPMDEPDGDEAPMGAPMGAPPAPEPEMSAAPPMPKKGGGHRAITHGGRHPGHHSNGQSTHHGLNDGYGG